MLKKYIEIKWNTKARICFSEVKLALTTNPILISPDFTKNFMIFSFAFEHTIATILLQNNSKDMNGP